MKLLKSYLVGNVKRMNDNNVRMAYIGRTAGLPRRDSGDHAVGVMKRPPATAAPP